MDIIVIKPVASIKIKTWDRRFTIKFKSAGKEEWFSHRRLQYRIKDTRKVSDYNWTEGGGLYSYPDWNPSPRLFRLGAYHSPEFDGCNCPVCSRKHGLAHG